MADDMANGGSSFDAQARYAALDERVTNLRTSVVGLEGEMRSGFTSINSHLTSLSNELRSSQKTQWPVIWAAAGVVFSVLVGIGGALYLPVLSNIADIKLDVKDLRSDAVPRTELEARAARGVEDRARTESSIVDLRATMVARAEWMERNSSRDKEIANLREEFASMRTDMAPKSERDLLVHSVETRFVDMQRQLDELKRFPTR